MKEPEAPSPEGWLDALEIIVMAEDSVMYESSCLGQHGISLLVRASGGGVTKTILLDVGQHHDALLHNFRTLGVDPAELDAIVITHCHYDHTRGLARMVAAAGKRNLPVVAHPSVFRPNFVSSPHVDHVGMAEDDSEARLREAGAAPILTADPFGLMPGLFTTGEVRRATGFEDAAAAGLWTMEDGKARRDDMPDDLSLVARVRGRAPVVLTGCSHAGIVNILEQAASMCGTRVFENVIGGLHLVEAPDGLIRQTCEGLSGFELKAITAGHCTGFRAQVELRAAFGEAFAPLQTGMRFRIASP